MGESISSAIEGGALLLFYVVLCAGSALWFIAAMLFGEASDAIGDAFDAIGADGDIGEVGEEVGDGNVLTLRNILLFCMGFGGGGAIAVSLGAGLWISVLAGTLGGLLIAAVGVAFFRVLHRQEATTAFDAQALVGKTGTVTLEIKPGGMAGEVSVVDNRGAQVRLAATLAKGFDEPIGVGSPAAIRAVHGGGNVVVAPTED